MKYWTRFTLQIMARAGLSVTVILWVVSQWGVSNADLTFGGMLLRVQTTDRAVAAIWCPHIIVVAPLYFSGESRVQRIDIWPLPRSVVPGATAKFGIPYEKCALI